MPVPEWQTEFYRQTALKYGLKLEIMGMRKRGRQASTIIREELHAAGVDGTGRMSKATLYSLWVQLLQLQGFGNLDQPTQTAK